MAEKGLTVRMKTDTSGFKKGMDEVVEELNKYNKALIDNQYKQRDANKVISEAQREIKNLKKAEEDRAKQLENEKKRREELNKIIEDASKELDNLDKIKAKDGQLSKEQEKQYKSLSNTITKSFQELDKLTMTEEKKAKLDEDGRKKIAELSGTIESEKVKLSQLRTEQVNIKTAITEASKATVEEGQAIEDTTETVEKSNESWTVFKGTLANLASDTLKKLGSELVNVARDVVQTGEQFSASMSEVGAISGATAEELAELEAAARLYGATTKFSATEAADALKYMALAGWNSQQAIAGLPAVLDLAAASGMDLGRASDIVTDYITAFGLEVEDASRFVDIMSYAMSHSNTTTEMLGEAYKNCAANAHAMGFSVEDVTAALMTMANSGIKGGEAGTSLNAIMTRLATNTKGCADILHEYGIEIYDNEKNMRSLSGILTEIAQIWGTLSDEVQNNLAKQIAGQNQIVGFQTVMAGLSESAKNAGMSFEDYTAALEQCEGTSNDMAKTMSNNLTGDLKALQSALDELKLKIYEDAETPLRNIVKLAKDGAVPALEGIIKNLKYIIPVIVGATTAMVSFKASIAISSIIETLSEKLDKLRLAQVAETMQTKLHALAWEELNFAQKANVIGLVTSLAIGLASWLATLLTVTQENTEAMEQANESAKDYTQTLKELNQQELDRLVKVEAEAQTLRTLQSEYDTLRTKAKLTKEEKSKLDSVASELAKTLGITTQELKNQDGTYKEITGDIDEYIKKLQEQVRFEMAKKKIEETTEAFYQLESDIESTSKALDEHKQKLDELRKKEEEYKKQHGGKVRVLGIEEEEKEIERLSTELENLKGQYNDVSNAMKQAEQDFNDLGKSLNGANDGAEDTVKVIETVTKKTETLSEKYNRLNGLLEENEKAIKDVNDEIENAMDSGDTEHLEQLQNKLKELNYENTTLKKRIKAVTDEINKDANAIVDAIDSMTKSAKLLATAEKEIADNGKFTLSTLNNIQKAYPELIDLTNQYIEGVRTEKDVIEGLKAAYENDKTAFSDAVAAKKLLSKNYSEDFVNNTINLFNEIRDKYDIDVTNFKNAADAKQAINEKLYDEMLKKRAEYDKLNADKNYMVLHNIDRGQADYKEFEYFKYDNVQNTWRAATSAEIDYYKKVQQDFLNSVDNYYDFQNQSTFDDVYNAYLSGRKSADNLYDFINTDINSSGSGKNDSEKKNPVTLSGYDVTATGDTYAKAYMTWVDRLKSLGKITESGEIYYLEKLKERTDNTAEEIYQIDLKLYQARKKLAEDNAKSLADIEKKNQDELQERLNLAKAAYDRLVNGKIESLQKEAQAAKDTADAEIAALDAVMKKRNEEKEDQKRNAEINKINERLKYNRNQLTDMEITDLYRRRQELIDEQNEVNYQRSIEQKKADILANADTVSFNVNNAVSALQNNLSEFTNHVAALMGTQTAAQKVVNNNQQQNIQIVQNALSNDQLVQKLIRELQKSLYTG